MSIGIHLPGVLFMKVSVVIPAYNEEKFIKGCLQSLMEQEEKADEIIVVDNNSTDKTVKICKEFPVEIVYEPVQGITSARNAGFDKAAFDLIARCDADTIVPYDWIEKIKADFRKSNIDLLAGPVSFYDGPIKTSFPSRLFLFALKKLKKQHFTIGANMIITKAFWEKIKKVICLDDRKVHEDFDLALHAGKIGGVIGYDKSLVVKVSARRIKKRPQSFFIEYPIRLVKTLYKH
ncbi:MAG: hypothetical protein A3F31_04230 [Candidatus Levybacteria bacterium RIFCSPHIGHO2_12_FULL_38_12]|nr:MAG: hypothetical protein A3F31_04230 [Candidatus Levybacteria bacterium RIFCSPHIGHO2_12_FULL_38_12]OGH34405.1 MAG: hypothetical protein A3A47_04625 [Candidatus Levybacteria bacterium RIFCSPLOWO2_01_FULL_37_20]OGH44411.1 MAG: hypothetical protein A3J14_03085 [Candidatus Levybacteria bacterium RIFCSPLOWO2_02_FULL_37_18]